MGRSGAGTVLLINMLDMSRDGAVPRTGSLDSVCKMASDDDVQSNKRAHSEVAADVSGELHPSPNACFGESTHN